MPGPEEDDDETLIADTGMADESTDEGRTLVVALPHDDQDETLIAKLPMRVTPRGPLPAPGALPRQPSRPTPAAGRTSEVIPAAAVLPAPKPKAAPVAVDLDRRALPFAVAPKAAPPQQTAQPQQAAQPQRAPQARAAAPKGDFFPVANTQPLGNVAHGRDPAKRAGPSAAPPTARASAPPPAPRASVPPPAPRASAPPPAPRASTPAPAPRATPTPPPPAPLPVPAPPAPRPPPAFAAESGVDEPAAGTPLFVIRFLLVCGVLTALGLMALIYLEL